MTDGLVDGLLFVTRGIRRHAWGRRELLWDHKTYKVNKHPYIHKNIKKYCTPSNTVSKEQALLHIGHRPTEVYDDETVLTKYFTPILKPNFIHSFENDSFHLRLHSFFL